MSLAGLLSVIADDPQLRRALDLARAGDDAGGPPGAGRDQGSGPGPGGGDLVGPAELRPFLAAALAAMAGRFVLAVTATAREADDLTAALGSLLPPESVACFPAWETLPHERLSPRSDTVGQRLAVLRRVAHPDPSDQVAGPLSVVVTPVRGLLQPIVAGLGDLEPVRLAPDRAADQDEVLGRLIDIGYTRADLVEKRGDLAVRGGILDVFPPTEEHPLRVEFFGDTVEEIRYFKVADQRSLGQASVLWAPPCRELLLTPAVRERAKELAAAHPGLADVLGKLADGIAVEGMEAFAPVLAERMELLLDHVPPGGCVLACDPERIRTRAGELVRTSEEFLAGVLGERRRGRPGPDRPGRVGVPGDNGGARLGQPAPPAVVDDHPVRRRRRRRGRGRPEMAGRRMGRARRGEAGAAGEAGPAGQAGMAGETASAAAGVRHRAPARRRPTAATPRGSSRDVRRWLAGGWRVVLVTEGHGPAQRLTELLRGEGLGARLADLDEAPEPGVPYVSTGLIGHGFSWPRARLAVLTESDLAGQRIGARETARMPTRRRGGIDPLELRPGDYVVHEQHGVGRYLEMTSRTVAGATREYLVIEYAPSKRGQPPDRLYVPTDQLDEVTRYSGGEAPSLHRLGGADWAKTKGRARKAVRQIAAELIRLYSARTASPGHAFAPDTPWQRELEDAFPYVETPDQLAAIDEVKQDMERPVPMDRLICGDVGNGKTEIAVRAAFKAVQDGMQAAILVPTTLLVQQHAVTFGERYAPFPVKVRALSRFQSNAEAAETLSGLADGTVDVVIGTHRLLSPETRFKRLGLLIIDEEQKFGVEHKEYLKRLRTEVDVLSMSATPIPRTLEMGVAGIREMSTILTPPEERHPVLTFVGAYDEKQIAAAIRRELLRDGQVFFVHNRVASIGKVGARIAQLVPEARVAIAHGQMNEHTLEKIMVDFWERNYDVLVATTIVESGLDIPNANTLVVDRADAYGLSQLHQLRGRVGRARERAYAYFLFPPERALTETAHERLATVAQHTEIGAGLHVAMKDLEIRGAGNLLGGEQSGHIAGVGFDLYVRMIGEAVSELRGGAAARQEVRVELPVNAHIPHEYVPGERLRLEAYTRIAAIESDDDAAAVRDELTDRYGPPPVPVLNLLEVARLRERARRAGLADITVAGSHVRFAPVELPESREVRVHRLYPGTVLKPAVRTMLVPAPKAVAGRPQASGRQAPPPPGAQPLRDQDLLTWCRELVEAIFGGLRPAAAEEE